ncbi:50S ribosomal protein L23 [Staphylococcus aureus]
MILKRPVFTENLLKQWLKTNTLSTLILVLTRQATAVEEIFNVKVASVNIMNYKPKEKTYGPLPRLYKQEKKSDCNS